MCLVINLKVIVWHLVAPSKSKFSRTPTNIRTCLQDPRFKVLCHGSLRHKPQTVVWMPQVYSPSKPQAAGLEAPSRCLEGTVGLLGRCLHSFSKAMIQCEIYSFIALHVMRHKHLICKTNKQCLCKSSWLHVTHMLVYVAISDYRSSDISTR